MQRQAETSSKAFLYCRSTGNGVALGGMEANSPQQEEKKGWLRRLEQESWQSELIISGIAIYGSGQLPDFIDGLAGWSVGYSTPGISWVVYAIFIYLYVGVYALLLSFVFHFILRAIWVGLVGLNSVFPKGINPGSTTFPAYFMRQLGEEFSGDNEQNIHRLDDFCSLIFAIGALAAMTFLAINVDLLILLGLRELLTLFLPANIVSAIGITIGGIFLLLSLFTTFVNGFKTLQKLPQVEKWHYAVNQFNSRVMLNIFYRPINRLSYTFSTNLKLGSYTLGLMVFFSIIMVMAAYRLINSPALFLADSTWLNREYSRTDRLQPPQYENLRTPGSRIHSLLIPADVIKDPFMRVFVPILPNESATIDSLCGEWKDKASLSSDENRNARRAFVLSCYEKYHRFYIDDSLYQVKLKFFDHPNAKEEGVITYLPIGPLAVGEHVLKVEKLTPDGQNAARIMQAPFWKGE